MPALQHLATVEQLGAILRADLEPGDPGTDLLLGWASDAVRTYTGQDISRVDDDVVVLGPLHGRLTLPQRPVISVSLVEQHTIATDEYTPLDPAEYRLDPDGNIFSTGYGHYYGNAYWPYGWPVHSTSHRVTYSHGYDEIPAGVAGVTASLAARIRNMPPGILNERNGQRGATFRAEDFLTPLELMTLGNYREARIA